MSELLPVVAVFAVWAIVAGLLFCHERWLKRKTRESDGWRKHFVEEEIRQSRR